MLDQRFAWNNKVDFPRHGDKPTGMKATIVHKADAAFPFLHDTMVVPLLGKIFMAWYNCSEAEIVGRTVIRGCWSDDGGVPPTCFSFIIIENIAILYLFLFLLHKFFYFFHF